MSTGRFRCIHCGDRFDLTPKEMETFSEGFFNDDQDCCNVCIENQNYQEYDTYSDADPGL